MYVYQVLGLHYKGLSGQSTIFGSFLYRKGYGHIDILKNIPLVTLVPSLYGFLGPTGPVQA